MSQAKYPYTLLKQLQWVLSALAIIACLYSVSSIHHHEAGYQSAESDCISCSLEEVTAHGSILSKSPANPTYFVEMPHKATIKAVSVRVRDAAFEARAPPIS